MKTVLGIFCKQPIPGTVKTRLAAGLGPDAAARLYEAFLIDIVDRVRAAADRVMLCYTPDTAAARDYFQRLAGEAVGIVPQQEGDLGERLSGFFDAVPGPRKVVVIGSDTPTITGSHIQVALAILERPGAVLGRSSDGGYYLVGLRERREGLFDDVDWSTPAVFEQQRARLHKAGIGTRVLKPIPEVDTMEDLHQLLRDPLLGDCPQTCRVLSELNLR